MPPKIILAIKSQYVLPIVMEYNLQDDFVVFITWPEEFFYE
jgi:hypothetical protein